MGLLFFGFYMGMSLSTGTREEIERLEQRSGDLRVLVGEMLIALGDIKEKTTSDPGNPQKQLTAIGLTADAALEQPKPEDMMGGDFSKVRQYLQDDRDPQPLIKYLLKRFPYLIHFVIGLIGFIYVGALIGPIRNSDVGAIWFVGFWFFTLFLGVKIDKGVGRIRLESATASPAILTVAVGALRNTLSDIKGEIETCDLETQLETIGAMADSAIELANKTCAVLDD